MKKALAYIDGSGNSDRIQACAVSMRVDHGSGEPVEMYSRAELLPGGTTNNVGEYSGLLLAIRLAKELDVEVLEIRSDSKLIVNQVKGNWKCKDNILRSLRNRAREEALAFHKVTIEWVPREENRIADSLCRGIVKTYESSPNNPFLRVQA